MRDDDISFDLSRIKVERNPSDIPDQLTAGSQDQLAHEKQAFELEALKKNQENIQKSFIISNWLAIGIFILVFLTLGAVFGIIIWQGGLCPEYRLSDKVIITLLLTMPINIIGLLYLVIKYVFHHRLKM